MAKESTFSKQIRSDLKRVYGDKIFVQLHMDAPRSGRKPYDAYFLMNREHVAMEFKKTTDMSVNVDIVTGNQIEFLKAVDKTGTRAWVIVWFVRYETEIAFDIEIWLEIKEEVERLGKKSIRYERLIETMVEDEDFEDVVRLLHRRKVDNKLCWEVEKLTYEYEANRA